MAGPRVLPFEYLIRGSALEYLDGAGHAAAIEQRDRDLEDFLAGLAAGGASAAKRYAMNCLAATSTAVTHGFGTRDVVVNVYRVASPYDTVECDVERTDTNNVTVRFATAPAAGEYRVVVLA